jgi:hypothetical protein
MNKQDVVNTIYNHYIDNYGVRVAVEACEFLGVKPEEIETAARFWEVNNEDPDESALCKCDHKKKDHEHSGSFMCEITDCACTGFRYLDEPWPGSGTTAPE